VPEIDRFGMGAGHEIHAGMVRWIPAGR
jgi:hypothetical protein